MSVRAFRNAFHNSLRMIAESRAVQHRHDLLLLVYNYYQSWSGPLLEIASMTTCERRNIVRYFKLFFSGYATKKISSVLWISENSSLASSCSIRISPLWQFSSARRSTNSPHIASSARQLRNGSSTASLGRTLTEFTSIHRNFQIVTILHSFIE
ncbi:hypothetical protein PMAYCL1PPCAC_22153 [Pristionchus mayeri]|uniref:Uncharacterized protein n=1 Tax=Pristionchus mayeri TaxID=1317129 RepID=A0AAN5I4J5_9BILA|nr:hypothetical protein PMAYCL1PPCAC_22153 [Pristionchus mayeri]